MLEDNFLGLDVNIGLLFAKLIPALDEMDRMIAEPFLDLLCGI